ncbi:C40 family peptidase [Nocardia iowensis]|uniref:C40 family peptidase n=1 Tax=Nocardia iowensis TaxID=204891 RepID=A0ABX8S283_NOCIO|nr:NlpC/P60 family protein [Nocardia iowensis]QXN94665.1 C40 family peptidase [Nocardia iowensis]
MAFPSLPAAPPPVFDPDVVARLAPAALPVMSAALPMITDALRGLGGADQTGSDAAASGGISPEARRAIDVLQEIEALYGEGATVPAASEPGTFAASAAGAGSTLGAYQRAELFQRNAAGAFSGLDAELSGYLTKLAKDNGVSAAALGRIRQEVFARIRAIGPAAITREGKQEIDRTVMHALQQAHAVVGSSQAKSAEIAGVVNGLANRYLGGLIMGSAGANAAGLIAKDAAMAQQGKKYVFATSGPGTFDCSGLTKFAAARAGIKLPHNAEAQYQTTKKIDPNPRNLRPGDLIFPSSAVKSDGRQGHVMLYIGNNQVVHATGGRGVVIDQLPRNYRASRWAA